MVSAMKKSTISKKYNPMTTNIENNNGDIRSLISLSCDITTEKYLEDILKLIVTIATNITNVKICSIWIVDEVHHPPLVRLKASHDIDTGYVKNRSLQLNEGIAGIVATTAQAIVIDNVLADQMFKEKEMAERLGLATMLSIPMQKEQKVIGVMNCFTKEPHHFSKREIRTMEALASQAATVIRNTELMVRKKLIEEELSTRKKIKKAQNIIMDRLNIGMEEAFSWIQQHSIKSMQSNRKIAEAILISA